MNFVFSWFSESSTSFLYQVHCQLFVFTKGVFAPCSDEAIQSWPRWWWSPTAVIICSVSLILFCLASHKPHVWASLSWEIGGTYKTKPLKKMARQQLTKRKPFIVASFEWITGVYAIKSALRIVLTMKRMTLIQGGTFLPTSLATLYKSLFKLTSHTIRL